MTATLCLQTGAPRVSWSLVCDVLVIIVYLKYIAYPQLPHAHRSSLNAHRSPLTLLTAQRSTLNAHHSRPRFRRSRAEVARRVTIERVAAEQDSLQAERDEAAAGVRQAV